MNTPVDAARKARRGLTLILAFATFGFLAYSLLVPAVGAADSAKRVTVMQPSPVTARTGRTTSSTPSSVVFPVVPSADRRYLRDQNGQPFPILGRTAWCITTLSVSDYQSFLDDTAAKGFNAIEFNFLNRWGYNAPFGWNSELPFVKLTDGSNWNGSMAAGVNPDYTTPNENYWAHVDGILAYALSKGILCFAFPSYWGQNTNLTDGWGLAMLGNGSTKMASYGSWIATRYKTVPNLVWLLGGDHGTNDHDFSPTELAIEQAMLSGMQSVSGQLSTNFSAEWSGPEIYTTQTDPTLLAAGTLQGACTWDYIPLWCRNGYAATPVMPTFLLEGPYDEEGPDGTNVNSRATQPVRRFQWWTFLSGIGGYVTGNGYVYNFDPALWPNHMNTQGAQDMARLNAFIKSVAWATLVPDGLGGIGTIVTAGGNGPSDSTYVAAAVNPAGTLLVAYVPPDHNGTFTVDMTKMSGPAQARWYNPTTAIYTLISPSIANTGTHTFTPPGDNGSGYDDWVLVLDAATANPTPTPTPTPTATAIPTPTQTPTPTPPPHKPVSNFLGLTPCRLVDTRRLSGPLGGPALDAATPRTFAVANVCNVPSTARAIVVNITVIGPSTAGAYRLYAADIPPPIATNLSFSANQTRSNNAVVALSGDDLGRFTVQPDLTSGTSHLVVDVNGYFQ